MTIVFGGCGSGVADPSSEKGGTEAAQSDIVVASTQAGSTPFIASVQFFGRSIAQLASVGFSIAAKPNSVSQPVNVTWSVSALASRGYLKSNLLNLPVFGLYENYQNALTVEFTFNDGSTQQLQDEIATAAYTDAFGIYLNPTIVKARAAGSTLGYNFFILKSLLESPVIVDTDAQVRWVVPATGSSSVYFGNGQFVSGDNYGPDVSLIQLDGTQSPLPADLPQPLMGEFTHNIDPGPIGLLAEFNGNDDLGSSVDDVVAEISPFTSIAPIQTYDMADILSSYMRANGDDPTAFVRPGSDWFHANASAYDPSDDTVIVSSREDFLIKLNYSTHEIVWIFGDPTKYWYTFPSLRAKALTLDAGGNYPIGQHAVSLTADGYTMVFNDGLGSVNQPPTAPTGQTRSYSEVSTYSIDATAMTAHEVWGFNYGQSIFSPICGSSYEAAGGGYLVDFATADNEQQARLVGLDPNRNVVFDFQYESPSACAAAWNAIPIPLENLQIQ